ncbi:MAG: hypothetical protein SGCHY_000931 [Lobulomycetales sp.]
MTLSRRGTTDSDGFYRGSGRLGSRRGTFDSGPLALVGLTSRRGSRASGAQHHYHGQHYQSLFQPTTVPSSGIANQSPASSSSKTLLRKSKSIDEALPAARETIHGTPQPNLQTQEQAHPHTHCKAAPPARTFIPKRRVSHFETRSSYQPSPGSGALFLGPASATSSRRPSRVKRFFSVWKDSGFFGGSRNRLPEEEASLDDGMLDHGDAPQFSSGWSMMPRDSVVDKIHEE